MNAKLYYLFHFMVHENKYEIRDKHEVTRVGVLSARPFAPEKTYKWFCTPNNGGREGGWGVRPKAKKEWGGSGGVTSVDQGEDRGM